MVVPIGIYQYHALPSTQRRATAQDGQDDRRRDEGREQVVRAVTLAAVAVAVPVITGQERPDGGQEIFFRP